MSGPNWPVGRLTAPTVAAVGEFPAMGWSASPFDLDGAERKGVERAARIKDMIHRWRHKLNLTHWDVRYTPEPPPKTHDEQIHYSFSGQAAVISIAPYADYQAAEGLVVHALLHLLLKPYTIIAERNLVHVGGDTARTQLNEMLEDAEEALIENIARAFVGGYPRLIVTDDSEAEWAAFK